MESYDPMTAAAKLEPRRIPDDQRLPDDAVAIDDEGNEGIVLPPRMEEWFDEMIAETDLELGEGRVHTLEEVLAKLRRSA